MSRQIQADARDHGRLAVFWALLAADFERIVRQTSGSGPVPRTRRLMHLLLPAMQCATLHRIAHLLHRRGFHRLAAGIAGLSVRMTGATIHPGSRLGAGLFVPHPVGVAFCGTAGRDLMLLPNAVVLPDRPVALSRPFPDDAPKLGEGVVIGARSMVWGPVRLGDHAVLGVGVTTLRDVPADAVTVPLFPDREAAAEGACLGAPGRGAI